MSTSAEGGLYAYVVRPFFLFMALAPFMDALHLSAWDQTGVGIGVVGFLFAADHVATQRLERVKVTVSLKDAGFGAFPMPDIKGGQGA